MYVYLFVTNKDNPGVRDTSSLIVSVIRLPSALSIASSL